MKARITWLIEGDKNTGFFHTSALVWRRRNRISCLKDQVGNWINGDREVAHFLRCGYAELFISSHSCSSLNPWDPPFWQVCVKEEDLVKSDCPVIDEEIKAGLWSLKAFKAPGPDGLHAGFFHRFWLVVGDSVREEIKQIFSSACIPKYLNQTLITLIPKCKNLESFNNYRPISLCNTVYKVVSKIIVARIRPLLADLVSSLQAAFVLGKKGIDNAIIVQEIVHTLSRKKGRLGFMAIKIDLEKAYDLLEWSFIRDTLNFLSF